MSSREIESVLVSVSGTGPKKIQREIESLVVHQVSILQIAPKLAQTFFVSSFFDIWWDSMVRDHTSIISGPNSKFQVQISDPELGIRNLIPKLEKNVDDQNKNDKNYIRMSDNFENSIAFKTACDLVFKGTEQPSGYTEPLLHLNRLHKKSLNIN